MTNDEYVLTRLIEQCAAVTDRCTKALCYGPDGQFPLNNGVTNARRLKIEINGLLAVLDVMEEQGADIHDADVRKTKRRMFKQRTTTAKRLGGHELA